MLFDGSHLDVAENTRQTAEVVAEADALRRPRRGRDRDASAASRTASAPTRAATSTRSRCPAEFIERPGVYAFAPGDRHRARPLREEARAACPSGSPSSSPAPDPDGAARRHRSPGRAVPGPDRARLRQGEHLDGAQDRLHRHDTASTSTRTPAKHDPPSLFAARARGGAGDGRAAHAACSARRAGGAAGRPPVPALIFDCDGVLADTERDGHLPAFNQTFAEVGLPVRWSEEEYAEKLKIGGGKERMASLLTAGVRARERPARRPRRPARAARRLAQAQDRRLQGDRAPRAGCRPGPGSRASSRRRSTPGWTLAVASTSAAGVGRGGARARRRRRARRAVRRARRRHRAEEEARPGHLPARARAHRARARTRRSSSRTRATACSPPSRRACAASSRSRATPARRTCSEAALVVSDLGDPGAADARAREPQPGDARRDGHIGRPPGVPGGPGRTGGAMSEVALSTGEGDRPHDRRDRDGEREVLLRPRCRRRRRRLRLLARPRVRQAARGLGRDGVRGRRRAPEEDRDRALRAASAARPGRSGARRSCAPAAR